MSGQSYPTLYIRLRKRLILPKDQPIRLGQVAQLIVDPYWEPRLQQLILHQPQKEDGNFVLVDMMQVVRKVKQVMPETTIEHFGEPHVIVELDSRSKRARTLMLPIVWMILFIGSGLAIMNFHTDVSMPEVHRKLYKLITGKEELRPLMLQIPYSIGIGVGMIIFFNRLFRKKFNEEPNPLEVEMFMYQENIHQYVINDEYAKKQEGDQP